MIKSRKCGRLLILVLIEGSPGNLFDWKLNELLDISALGFSSTTLPVLRKYFCIYFRG